VWKVNNSLLNFKFNDLLPTSIKDDPKFIAASNCLDKLLSGLDDRMNSMLVYSRIDELTESEIDDLAWQWNVGYFEGYSFAETLNDKRILVKHAIQLHWYKGTRWALESIPVFLGMPAFAIEWFEADLIGSKMKPYEFDLAIDTGVRGISPTIHDDIQKLINNLKNVRSYLRHVVLMASWKVTAYYGAVSASVNVGAIRPKDWQGSTTEIKYGRAIIECSAMWGHVQPQLWTEKETKIKNRHAVGYYAATEAKVYPQICHGSKATMINKNRIGGYSAIVGRVNPRL
jgi:P2-related tail formation protein